jgi:NAD-dependent dihydropyrimidine dehydrogenase PreA subunit
MPEAGCALQLDPRHRDPLALPADWAHNYARSRELPIGPSRGRAPPVTFIIGQPCIDNMDQSCIDVCPVDCIIPTERMLVIDPDDCIDCGSCVPACPVHAIFPDTEVPLDSEPFIEINAAIVDGVEAVNALVAQYSSSLGASR